MSAVKCFRETKKKSLSIDYGTFLMSTNVNENLKYNLNILKMTMHLNFYLILLIELKFYQYFSFMPI